MKWAPNHSIRWGLAIPCDLRDLGYHCCRQRFVVYSMPSHCLNKYWPIINRQILTYHQSDHQEHISMTSYSKFKYLYWGKCVCTCLKLLAILFRIQYMRIRLTNTVSPQNNAHSSRFAICDVVNTNRINSYHLWSFLCHRINTTVD